MIYNVKAANANVTFVIATTTPITLLQVNTKREGVFVYNDSNSDMYIKYGTGASTTSFTLKVPPNSFYEMPRLVYTGIITAVWGGVHDGAYITELS